jgi:hypothetical protein
MSRTGPRRTPTAGSGLVKRVVRFVAIFLVVTAVMAGLWSFIAPGYSAAVTGLSRPLFRLVESPNASVLELRGAEIWIYRIVGPGEIAPFTWFDRYTFFAVIPLLALLVATPGLGWSRRFGRLAGGVGALLLVHVGYLVASVELSYAALRLAPVGPFLARTLDLWQVGVRVLWEAAPVAIWILLTLGAWRRILRGTRCERRCGSLSADAMGASH